MLFSGFSSLERGKERERKVRTIETVSSHRKRSDILELYFDLGKKNILGSFRYNRQYTLITYYHTLARWDIVGTGWERPTVGWDGFTQVSENYFYISSSGVKWYTSAVVRVVLSLTCQTRVLSHMSFSVVCGRARGAGFRRYQSLLYLSLRGLFV